jgi:D-tyrosyl-tRNA(Tyr) deacylase
MAVRIDGYDSAPDPSVRALIQRVSRASVHVDGDLVSEIGRGLLVLLAVHEDDDDRQATYMAEKLANIRIFSDDEGQMNLSVLQVGGEALVISQFTLYADTRKGRRPSFVRAAEPRIAEPLVQGVLNRLADLGVKTCTGVFGAHMDVELVNDGPVTVLIETPGAGSADTVS